MSIGRIIFVSIILLLVNFRAISQINLDGYILNNDSNGIYTFRNDEDSTILQSGFFKNGLKHGVWTLYYPNGIPYEIKSYHEGLPNGIVNVKYYYPNGNLFLEEPNQEKQYGQYLLSNTNGETIIYGYYGTHGDKSARWTIHISIESKIVEYEYIFRNGVLLNSELIEKN